MNLSVIGAGYAGLVTGACLASKGHKVICVDVDSQKLERIGRGIPPFFEPGLEVMLQDLVPSHLSATIDLSDAVRSTDVSIVSVGTPLKGGRLDLSQIESAARGIGRALSEKDGYHVVVVKSTVPPGTTDTFVTPLLEAASRKHAGADFGVGVNPEFLRQGSAIDDFMHPDRIVLGAADQRALDVLVDMYSVFDGVPIVRTNNKTAEMIKYTSNAFLSTLISFSNEIANVCAAQIGIDVVDVMHGVHLDKRLTPTLPDGRRVTPGILAYLAAGCGFGGSCLPKDVQALIDHGRALGVPMSLLEAVIRINESQPAHVLHLLRKHFREMRGTRVAVLGFAYKPDTDDVRDSPALRIIEMLQESGALVQAYDPRAHDAAGAALMDRRVTLCASLEDAVRNVDAIIVITPWPEFARLADVIAGVEPVPLVVDARRTLAKGDFLKYEGVGLAELDGEWVTTSPRR